MDVPDLSDITFETWRTDQNPDMPRFLQSADMAHWLCRLSCAGRELMVYCSVDRTPEEAPTLDEVVSCVLGDGAVRSDDPEDWIDAFRSLRQSDARAEQELREAWMRAGAHLDRLCALLGPDRAALLRGGEPTAAPAAPRI